MDDPARYEAAKKRVMMLKGFYLHLTVYVLVNALLIAINLLTYPKAPVYWFYWPLAGWGVGVVAHAFFGTGKFLGKEWEERRIKKIMDKSQSK